MTKAEILHEAMSLAPNERDELAEALWQSISENEFTVEQRSEIRRRIEEIDSGEFPANR